MSDKFTTQAEAVAFLESMPALDIPHCGPNGYPCQECESLRAEVERLTTECIDKERLSTSV